MRLYQFKKNLRQAMDNNIPDLGWKDEARNSILAHIRKSKSWQEQPSDTGFEFGSLNSLFSGNILKPVAAMVLILTIVSSSFVTAVSAARASLPGDRLYAVKLGIERAQVGLTFSESKKTELEMSFAGTRLKEISTIIDNTTAEEAKNEVKLDRDPLEKSTKKKEAAENIGKAIERFNDNLNSVQERLEKISTKQDNGTPQQDETVGKKALEISKLVNEKTIDLEDNLLEIKQKITENAPQKEVAQPLAIDVVIKEAEEARQAAETVKDTSESLPAVDNSEKDVVLEATAATINKDDADLLETLDGALESVGDTNTKSLEVFVEKASESTDQGVKQEAVEKLQAKIVKIEKKLVKTEEKIEQVATESQGVGDVLLIEKSAKEDIGILNAKEYSIGHATGTAPIEETKAAGQEKEVILKNPAAQDASKESSSPIAAEGKESASSTPEILIDKKEDVLLKKEEPAKKEEVSIKDVIKETQEKPKQAKEAIKEVKKILDNKNTDNLGGAFEKVKEVIDIVKQANQTINNVQVEIKSQKKAEQESENIDKEAPKNLNSNPLNSDDANGQVQGEQVQSEKDNNNKAANKESASANSSDGEAPKEGVPAVAELNAEAVKS